jgi:hypothetical protein
LDHHLQLYILSNLGLAFLEKKDYKAALVVVIYFTSFDETTLPLGDDKQNLDEVSKFIWIMAQVKANLEDFPRFFEDTFREIKSNIMQILGINVELSPEDVLDIKNSLIMLLEEIDKRF